MGGSFDTFITKVMADNIIEDFVIDLTDAEYIDSTNLGLLARIQVFSVGKLAKRPTLISSNDTINSILQNLGFDRLFTIIPAPLMPSNTMEELPIKISNDQPIQNVLLSAHRYLSDTNMKNGIVFKEIVDLLEKDIDKKHNAN
jgi:anti-anti-sigma factor